MSLYKGIIQNFPWARPNNSKKRNHNKFMNKTRRKDVQRLVSPGRIRKDKENVARPKRERNSGGQITNRHQQLSTSQIRYYQFTSLSLYILVSCCCPARNHCTSTSTKTVISHETGFYASSYHIPQNVKSSNRLKRFLYPERLLKIRHIYLR
jgi:hypothetical protein